MPRGGGTTDVDTQKRSSYGPSIDGQLSWSSPGRRRWTHWMRVMGFGDLPARATAFTRKGCLLGVIILFLSLVSKEKIC